MTHGAAAALPADAHRGARRLATGLGAVLAVAACAPQLLGASGGGEVAETLRFALLAMAVPALVVLGAPWGAAGALGERRAAPRAARGASLAASLAWLCADVAAMLAWRSQVLVEALARHEALVLVEAATLIAAGVGLWLELVESPPLSPRQSRPRRAVLAAVAMWSVWILAYMEGMSPHSWYPAFRHVAGSGLSAAADRQLSTLVLWGVAAATFMPVVFVNLFEWLRAESRRDDPVAERLRAERAAPSRPGGLATE